MLVIFKHKGEVLCEFPNIKELSLREGQNVTLLDKNYTIIKLESKKEWMYRSNISRDISKSTFVEEVDVVYVDLSH